MLGQERHALDGAASAGCRTCGVCRTGGGGGRGGGCTSWVTPLSARAARATRGCSPSPPSPTHLSGVSPRHWPPAGQRVWANVSGQQRGGQGTTVTTAEPCRAPSASGARPTTRRPRPLRRQRRRGSPPLATRVVGAALYPLRLCRGAQLGLRPSSPSPACPPPLLPPPTSSSLFLLPTSTSLFLFCCSCLI